MLFDPWNLPPISNFLFVFDGTFGLVLKLIFLISKTFSSNHFHKECRDVLIPCSNFLGEISPKCNQKMWNYLKKGNNKR
jgi:hypothetical protein